MERKSAGREFQVMHKSRSVTCVYSIEPEKVQFTQIQKIHNLHETVFLCALHANSGVKSQSWPCMGDHNARASTSPANEELLSPN